MGFLFRRLNRKGQIFSGDALFAFIIFVFVVSASIVFSSQLAHGVSLEKQRQTLDRLAFLAGERLVFSPGEPANWENAESIGAVGAIGLSPQMNVIDSEKFSRMQDFASSDYPGLGERMGFGGKGYYISLRNLSDNSLIGELGVAPGLNTVVVSSKRVALFDGNIALLDVRAYQ